MTGRVLWAGSILDTEVEKKFLIGDVDLRVVPITMGKGDHPGIIYKLRWKLPDVLCSFFSNDFALLVY